KSPPLPASPSGNSIGLLHCTKHVMANPHRIVLRIRVIDRFTLIQNLISKVTIASGIVKIETPMGTHSMWVSGLDHGRKSKEIIE
ncbi:MAG TPA: hypothetical protein VK666_00860, partial [Chryseolinea sp.]|nr:hypothetical protein [Chryseolinea sp.]